jgi:hypothetical protein
MKSMISIVLIFSMLTGFAQEKLDSEKIANELTEVLKIANTSPQKFKEGERKEEQVNKPGYKYTKRYWITNQTINEVQGEFSHHVGMKEDLTQGKIDFIIAEWTYKGGNQQKAIVDILFEFYGTLNKSGLPGYSMTSFTPPSQYLKSNEGMRFYFKGESFNSAKHAFVNIWHLHNEMEKTVQLYIEVQIPKFN